MFELKFAIINRILFPQVTGFLAFPFGVWTIIDTGTTTPALDKESTRLKFMKNATECRDSRSAKSRYTR